MMVEAFLAEYFHSTNVQTRLIELHTYTFLCTVHVNDIETSFVVAALLYFILLVTYQYILYEW